MQRKTLREYRNELVMRLRAYELKRAGTDEEAVHALAQTPDGFLLRKWLWIATVTGGLASFIVMPLVLSFLAAFLPPVLNEFLWLVLKAVMAVFLIVFVFLVYVTVRSDT